MNSTQTCNYNSLKKKNWFYIFLVVLNDLQLDLAVICDSFKYRAEARQVLDSTESCR